MKKTLIITTLLVALFNASAYAADNDLIQDGTYVQLGRYDGDPILWRCVSTEADDENGKLILSDRILCYKIFDASHGEESNNRFGNGYWIDSNIRAWLNATTETVDYPCGYPPVGIGGLFSYDEERGFLSDDNFTDSEKSAMKSVSQWLILNKYHKDEITNGVENFFQTNVNSTTKAYDMFHYGSLQNLIHIEGGMTRCVDTMFLIDEVQAYKLWKKHDAFAAPTEKALADYSSKLNLEYNSPHQYWLRTQWGLETTNYVYDSDGYSMNISASALGVRPAFYLNEDNVKIISGSGTWENPYVIDGNGQSSTAVFCQNRQLVFDQEPVNENGRLLVPIRAIAESLGLAVSYDGNTKTIVARNEERTVTMQIGNTEIGNGYEVFTLEVAPQIIGDRTMVPLRAVSEAFGATVEYIENLNRVVIDKPAVQDFGDNYGWESWQIDRAILNGTYDVDEFMERYNLQPMY